MRVGCPKESKAQEYRTGLTLSSVLALIRHGHSVVVETGAGAGIGTSDDEYKAAGASIAANSESVFEQSELIVKVKEPNSHERKLLRPGHTLFTFLHLAADRQQAIDLQHSGATCIAYETVTNENGQLPLLFPMSEIAGRMAVQAGAWQLEKHQGGMGVLLSGATGVNPAKVVIIGAGVVGSNACSIAVGMGASVTVLDKSEAALKKLTRHYQGQVTTLLADSETVSEQLVSAHLVVGAVLAPGKAASKIISSDMVKKMQAGAVIVDVAIDQGGCCDNSRPTTHKNPSFVVDKVIHYCVANIPGAVPKTSSQALNNATLPYILELADKGILKAIQENSGLRNGVNIYAGQVTCESVAEDLALNYITVDQLM